MSDKIKVLSVDDNYANNQLILRGLEGHYEVDIVDGGNEALNKLKENDYDIILLDVSMPDIDGYGVCTALRQSDRNEQVPIIFISALTGLDDKLKGYAVGGQDYVEKPIMLQELIQKIELVVTQSKRLGRMDDPVKFASNTGVTPMSNNSQLGVIIRFMETSHLIKNNHDLLNAVIKSVSQYQIKCCVQVRSAGQVINGCSSSSGATCLETDLLEKAKDAERIVTLGVRGIFSSSRVSILIRDMPVEDEPLYGRLVDHLALIVVAADAQIKHIEQRDQKLGSRNRMLDNVVEIADEETVKLQEQFLHFRVETTRIMSELHANIEESLLGLKLNKDQEDHFFRLFDQGNRELADLSDLGAAVENSLGRIK